MNFVDWLHILENYFNVLTMLKFSALFDTAVVRICLRINTNWVGSVSVFVYCNGMASGLRFGQRTE